jgi:peptidoglycan/LPS O-acetylase OafA/YrhL
VSAALTPTRRPAPDPEPRNAPPRDFLPGVQALRAVAALLVVTFHLWPEQVRGGFAGVDVFFVISGFLITGHVAREIDRTGRISLLAFWSRRVKRLFPAALTVLAASLIATLLVLPTSLWQRSLHEIMASALYFENWALAATSVDYFAAEDPPTAAQHYWSLSVEEQFYIVWPLLFLLTALAVRRFPAYRKVLLAAVPLGVLVLSFVYSVFLVGDGSTQYFNTFTRAWEFAAGAVLALTVGAGRLPRRVAVPLLWVGLAGVLASGLLLRETMRFPGWVALLPVLGTVLVIAAGDPDGRLSPSALLRARPVQFLGGISYSLYLWHWPVIIFLGREPGATTANGVSRWLLLALSVVLAIGSTYLIEDPVRRWGGPGVRTRAVTLGLGAAAMAVITGVTLAGIRHADSLEAQAVQHAAQKMKDPCLGAAALDPTRNCAPADNTDPVPSPVVAFDDKPEACMQDNKDAALRVCSFGVPAAQATRQVAAVGDSHAMHWLGTLQVIAEQERWHLTALMKGSCPLTRATRSDMPAQQAAGCRRWNDAAQRWLAQHPEVSQVFVSSSSMNQVVPDPGRSWQQTAVAGYRAAWQRLPATIGRVVVLRDIPRPRSDVVTCSEIAVRQHRDVSSCGRKAHLAILDDPEALAARGASTPGRAVDVIDLNRFFCADDLCSPGIGGAFVYRDAHHMTATFSRTLAPYLLAAYRQLSR